MSLTLELARAGGFLVSEGNGQISRDQVTLAALNDGSTTLQAGTVLGLQNVGSKAAFTNAAGDTGNGTCGTITLSAGAQEGVYTFTCLVAGSTAKFQGIAPNGAVLPELTVGSAYSQGGLGFTITTGGVNYAVGDEFTITVGTAVFANAGGDTGNGTCSAIVVKPGVIGGVYTFTCTAGGATATFSGVDPTGAALPVLTVGSAYAAGGLSFTVSDGGSHYAIGDSFTITAYTGADLYVSVNASATDGSQVAAAVLFGNVYVGGSTPVKAAAVTRYAEVAKGLLVWPSGSTDDQIRNWTLQLASAGVIARSSV
jgi:hypothetical protein